MNECYHCSNADAVQCPDCGLYYCADHEKWVFHPKDKECGSQYPEPHEYLE